MLLDDADDAYSKGVYDSRYARNPHGVNASVVAKDGKLAFKINNLSTLDMTDGYTSFRYEVVVFVYTLSKWMKSSQVFGNIDLSTNPPDADGIVVPPNAPAATAGDVSTQASKIVSGMFVMVEPKSNDWGFPYYLQTGLIKSA